MVERCPEKAGVGSSILPLGTIFSLKFFPKKNRSDLHRDAGRDGVACKIEDGVVGIILIKKM